MKRFTFYITVLANLSFIPLNGQTIVNSKHNLSAAGNNEVKAASETEICIFCHTPHNAMPGKPLWNRDDPGQTYTLYGSSTARALPGQPDGSSLQCLSCHDGTIAPGKVKSRNQVIDFTGGNEILHHRSSDLSKDLSDDHPVSVVYNSSLAAAHAGIKDPAGLSANIKLENGKIQCISCHDPHSSVLKDFLVASLKSSELCQHCHQPEYWSGSVHQNSAATWNGIMPNPWQGSDFKTVAENGCENCHTPHHAGSKMWLLKNSSMENTCLNCHNGNVSVKNIQSEMQKSSAHKVNNYQGLHDPAEKVPVTVWHVACSDCHNAHAVTSDRAEAPYISGALRGVKGMDMDGRSKYPAEYEYEICFKCHSSGAGKSLQPATSRVRGQVDLRLKFSAGNTSFHPVTAPRNNPDVTQNLIPPNTSSTILYCSSCHSSDGSGAAQGPHGSVYPQILVRQYLKSDGATRNAGTTESAAAYSLCYGCHNRNNIINDIGTFPLHRKHIVEERTPCNTCHDPHGVDGAGPEYSSLVNFRMGIVNSNRGIIRFTVNGFRHGSCTLVCHGKTHDELSY